MNILREPSFVRDQIRIRIEKRIQAFEKGYRQNIGLVGSLGLGKSFVLSSIFNSLCAKARFIPIYINAEVLDFDHLVDRWIGAMLTGVFLSQDVKPPTNFQSLLLAADPLIPKTVDRIRQFKRTIRKERGVGALRELFALSGALSEETGKQIILMIDEFQALENLPMADPFALLGKEIMVEKNTLYVVTSSTPTRAREIFRDKLSLLFGNFEVVNLAPFGFSETIHFLESRLPGRFFTEEQKRFLIRMTDGNPSYLELLIDRLEFCLAAQAEDLHHIAESQGGITNEVLLESFYRELFSEKGRIALLFERRLENCRRLARDSSPYLRTLLAISHGRRKVLGIATFIEKKMLETKKILHRLLCEDIVVKRGSFYVVEDPLFRFWLREVHQKRNQVYIPDYSAAREELKDALKKEFERSEQEEKKDVTARVESLFKEFRNDVLEVEDKKLHCPQFSEIAFRPTNGRIFPLLAKNTKVRWICQVANQIIKEEDVLNFLDELKRYRKDVQRKIFVALSGIDQNAKLMAQEAKIQLWDLRNINTLLDLYDQPKIIPLCEKEGNETTLGALAQELHTA
jgi:hypothetical protein